MGNKEEKKSKAKKDSVKVVDDSPNNEVRSTVQNAHVVYDKVDGSVPVAPHIETHSGVSQNQD